MPPPVAGEPGLDLILSAGDGETWDAEAWEWDSLTLVARAKRLKAVGGGQAGPSSQDGSPGGRACSASAQLTTGGLEELWGGAAEPALPLSGGNTSTAPAGAPDDGALLGGGGSGDTAPSGKQLQGRPMVCQADGCSQPITGLSYYHQRNRICLVHIKADTFTHDGLPQRFCQRCGHAHAPEEFDAGKHSCRAQLEKHNARRRKQKQPAAEARPRAAAAGATAGRVQPAAARAPKRADAEARPERRSSRRISVRSAVAAAEASGYEDSSSAPTSPSGQSAGSEATKRVEGGLPQATALLLPVATEGRGQRLGSPPLPLLDIDDAGLEHLRGVLELESDLAHSLSHWLSEQLPELPAADSGAAQRARAGPGAGDGQQPPSGSFDLGTLLMQPQLAGLPQPAPQQQFQQQPSYGAAADLLSTTPPPAASALSAAAYTTAGVPSLAMIDTVSIKIFGCTPDELPPDLRPQLQAWFGAGMANLEGYIRPGCVHLTVQALLERQDAEAAGAGPSGGHGSLSGADANDAAARRVIGAMLASGDPFWRSKTLLMQAGSRLVLLRQGEVQRSWDVDSASTDRAVPAILHTSPQVVLASQPPALCVAGVNLQQPDCSLFCRLQGAYVPVQKRSCSPGACCERKPEPACCSRPAPAEQPAAAPAAEFSCNGCCIKGIQDGKPGCCEAPALQAGKRAAQTVWLQPSAPLRPGLLHIDAQKGAYMASRGGRALVVDCPVVRDELLAFGLQHPDASAPALEQLGVVYEWRGNPAKLAYSFVEGIAARMLYWAVGCALPATAAALLSVLEERAVEGRPDSGACAASDGLALLHSAAQLGKAAALRRAEELGGKDGLSLVHKAVQSRSVAMLAEVGRWAEEACTAWRFDLAGPMGLTPLHLAALVPDAACARAMVALLLKNSDAGSSAWEALCTTDGLSPADFARRTGHGNLLAAPAPAPAPAQAKQPAASKHAGLAWEPAQLRVSKRAKSSTPGPDGMHPSTPRRCMCLGDCPCASAAEPCAGCTSDDEGKALGCGSQDGTCACCRSSGEGGCCSMGRHT